MLIKWLDEAIEDIDQIAEYLNEHNPQSSRKFAQEVWDQAQLLLTFPELGRIGKRDTRELVLKNFPYIVPYRIVENQIEILRVFPTRMNPPDFWL